MKQLKYILLFLSLITGCGLAMAQTPVSPVQLTTNTAYLEPSTGLHWNYNGTTYGWYKELGVKDSSYYVTPSYLSTNYYNKTQSDARYAPIGSGVTSVLGTTNRITTSPTTGNVTVDISPTFEALLGKVANPLSQFASTTSAQLAGIISDETGSSSLVFANSPTLVTPNLGTPSALVGTNITGTGNDFTSGNSVLWGGQPYNNTLAVSQSQGLAYDNSTNEWRPQNAAGWFAWLKSESDAVYQPLNAKLTAFSALASSNGVLTNTGGVYSWTTPTTGTVTSVSVVTANGVSGSVATATTTPAITLTVQDAGANGVTKGISAFTASDFDETTGVISLDYTNGQSASGATKGYLTPTDWTTFNSKQSALSGTGLVKSTGGTISYITDNSSDWNIAYNQTRQWDGGSTGLVAATGRTSLGGTTVGQNFFTLTNPSAITFPRINTDNTVSALDAATFRAAIGAGTSSTTGTVTSVAMSAPTGFSVSGSPITTNGTLALSFASGYSLPSDATQATWTAKQDAISFGTGVLSALGVNIGSDGAPVLFNGAGGTPSSLTLTNATGLPYSGLTGTVPTWNQNTTGSAATLTTTRTIWGQNFNGSADVSGLFTGTTATFTRINLNSGNVRLKGDLEAETSAAYDIGASAGNKFRDLYITGTANSANANFSALSANSLLGLDAGKNTVSITALPSGTTAATQSANDNSTKVATTAYVDAAVATFISGTYTPTQVSTNTNVSSISFNQATYIRVGDIVTVSGAVSVTPTTANLTTSIKFSLPIASNLTPGSTALTGVIGSMGTVAWGRFGGVQADAINDCAYASFYAGASTLGDLMPYTFSYTVN